MAKGTYARKGKMHMILQPSANSLAMSGIKPTNFLCTIHEFEATVTAQYDISIQKQCPPGKRALTST